MEERGAQLLEFSYFTHLFPHVFSVITLGLHSRNLKGKTEGSRTVKNMWVIEKKIELCRAWFTLEGPREIRNIYRNSQTNRSWQT